MDRNIETDIKKIEQKIKADVKEHGCSIRAVPETEEGVPSFAYSVGFTKTAKRVKVDSLPEVILFGVPDELYGPAINEIFQMGIGGFKLRDGARIENFFGVYDCIIRSVHKSWLIEEYFASALWFHSTQMRSALTEVVMLVWPDANHVYPWEEDCAEWVCLAQPALYEPRIVN